MPTQKYQQPPQITILGINFYESSLGYPVTDMMSEDYTLDLQKMLYKEGWETTILWVTDDCRRLARPIRI